MLVYFYNKSSPHIIYKSGFPYIEQPYKINSPSRFLFIWLFEGEVDKEPHQN